MILGKAIPKLQHVRRAVILISLCLLQAATSRANWVGSEGEEWLHWNEQTRSVYVRAYTLGSMQGYTSGCSEGLVSSTPAMDSSYTVDASKRCSARAPITSRDSSQFPAQITRFYRSYARQRYLRISDILLGLYAGKTLVQIHDSFPQK